MDRWYNIIRTLSWSRKQTPTTMLITIITEAITISIAILLVTVTLAVMDPSQGIEDTIVDTITVELAVKIVVGVVDVEMAVAVDLVMLDAVDVGAVVKEVVKVALSANYSSLSSLNNKLSSMSQKQLHLSNSQSNNL